ncbi:hypothetical protein TNCV_4138041 [Trichonephila clavipes]|nr:hypothetical protein TNCV_4138041 [Trichonephila clavipes]
MKCRSSDIKIHSPMGKNFKGDGNCVVSQTGKHPKIFVTEDTVDRGALDRFNVHRCPTRRVFSGTGLELVTRRATIRYLYLSTTADILVPLKIHSVAEPIHVKFVDDQKSPVGVMWKGVGGKVQLWCRPRHVTVVQNYEARDLSPRISSIVKCCDRVLTELAIVCAKKKYCLNCFRSLNYDGDPVLAATLPSGGQMEKRVMRNAVGGIRVEIRCWGRFHLLVMFEER